MLTPKYADTYEFGPGAHVSQFRDALVSDKNEHATCTEATVGAESRTALRHPLLHGSHAHPYSEVVVPTGPKTNQATPLRDCASHLPVGSLVAVLTNGNFMLDRYRGALLGLAVGDALGTTVEFKAPGTFSPVTDIIGGGPFNLKPGEWTDDTSMALCLAESLIQCRGFDAKDQMDRYCRWHEQGYLSSNGMCFDIGNTVASALARYRRTGNPLSGSESPNTAGNGSLMRIAPVPLFFAPEPKQAIHNAAESSRTTHGTKAAVDACRYFTGLLIGAVQGREKSELLEAYFYPGNEPVYWQENPLDPKIAAVAAGSFKDKQPPGIKGSGYVVESLEAALWAFHRSDSFREGALLAVNLGDDADTTGAILRSARRSDLRCRANSVRMEIESDHAGFHS